MRLLGWALPHQDRSPHRNHRVKRQQGERPQRDPGLPAPSSWTSGLHRDRRQASEVFCYGSPGKVLHEVRMWTQADHPEGGIFIQ